VSTRHRQERVALFGTAIQRQQLHIGEHQEVALTGVQQVRDTTAIAVACQRHQAFDAVARSLDPHPLLTEIEILLSACFVTDRHQGMTIVKA
jgi:hypothetical protein